MRTNRNQYDRMVRDASPPSRVVKNCIESLLIWVHEENSEIKDETLDKIRNFGEFYNEYLNRTNQEFDEDFYNDAIGPVLDKIKELYPGDINNESMTKYITKISDLEELIKKLKKEVIEGGDPARH